MRYLSVCSGIEAATVAWHDLGWTPVGFSEIEPFPSAVLAHHYPNVPNYGDMTKFEEWPLEPGTVDLLVGGTPCQSFSVAGLRKGISDPRGGLMLTYLEIARRFRPRWIVWENVPGVLSSGGGRDFGSLLGGLEELGYGWAYRVLDAQFVRTQRHPRAVPQRRRRVFVVGCSGDSARAAQILFERESVQRDPAKGRATRKGTTADAEAGIARCVTTGEGKRQDYETFTIIPQPVPYDLFQITAPVNRQNRQPGDPCHTLARDNAAHAAVAFANRTRDGIKVPEVMADGIVPALTNPGDGGRSDAINVAVESLQQQGYNGDHASTQEANAIATLRVLRDEIGEEAFAAWGLGVLDSLQPSQVLRARLHGEGIRCASFSRSWPIDCAISRPEDRAAWAVQSVREAEGEGCSPSRRELPQQLAEQLGAYLSQLPYPGPQAEKLMHHLWCAGEGIGILRQALSTIQEVRRSLDVPRTTPANTMTVRRLTATECEFLQGFPRNYTLIPWRKKPADECPDGPRYKALGNSMAVNCMAWIGERIHALNCEHDQ